MGSGHSHHWPGQVPVCAEGYHRRPVSFFQVHECEANLPNVPYDDESRWKRDLITWLPFASLGYASEQNEGRVTSAASHGVSMDLKTAIIVVTCLGAHLAVNYFGDIFVERLAMIGKPGEVADGRKE